MEIATLIISAFVAVWAIVNTIISYKQSLKIEKIKTDLDKAMYKSNVQFDYEFDSYKTLSRLLGEMIKANGALFPYGLYNEPQSQDELNKYHISIYNAAVDTYNSFSLSLEELYPFISENIYNEFDNIRKKACMQLNWFQDFRVRKERYPELREEEQNCWKRTKEILDDRIELNKQLKQHIVNLSNQC